MESLPYKITYNKDILNSLIFYLELSLYLCSKGVSENEACFSLKKYIEGLKKHYPEFNNPEILGSYLEKSYSKLPSSFLSLLGVPTLLNEQIYTVDVRFAWLPKL